MDSDRDTACFGGALTHAFGATALMGAIWFGVHHPAVHAGAPIRGLLLLIAFVGVMVSNGRVSRRPIAAGIAAGAIAALLQLTLLGGAVFATGDDSGASARPNALLAVGGFVALSVVLATAASWFGCATRGAPPPARSGSYWLSRFALVAALTVAPLILIGGIVTSTESGLAVPDWPRTFGANMFLYPINLMTRHRVFEEHAHRLFGSLVGLTTLTLMVYTLVRERSTPLRLFAGALFVLVVIQGVLGGMRVTAQSAPLGIAHGVLAQIFLALMVTFAMLLSPARQAKAGDPQADPIRRRVSTLAPFALGALLLQLILGASFRHLHGAGSTGALHMIWTHAGFAVVVTGLVLFVGFAASAGLKQPQASARAMGRAGMGMVICVFAQVILGVGALFLVLTADRRGPVPTADQVATADRVPLLEAVMATAHQANGALLIAMAVLTFAWARWPERATAPGAPTPDPIHNPA